MLKNKKKNIAGYFQEKPSKIIIIAIFIISICLVIFGFWIFAISFLIPQKASFDEIAQKQLKINSKLYFEAMEKIQANQQEPTQEAYNDPFK